MVLGHKVNGSFHPHTGGSGIYSSQVLERSTKNQDVTPGKQQKSVSDFINKHKEKFAEKDKIKEMQKNQSPGSVNVTLEERLNQDKVEKILHSHISPKFQIDQLKDMSKEKYLSKETQKHITSEIDRLELDLKARDEDEARNIEASKKDGSNVLFPGGSQNADTRGEPELEKFDSRNARAGEIKVHLDKRDKDVTNEEKKLSEQLYTIQEKQNKIVDTEQQIRDSKTISPENKRRMLSKVKDTKDILQQKKMKSLRGKSQAERQVLTGLGIVI